MNNCTDGTPIKAMTEISAERLAELLQHLTGCRRFNNGPCDCGARAAYDEFLATRLKLDRAREALQNLYDDNMEYFRINNLCGCENNHVIVQAREALAAIQP